MAVSASILAEMFKALRHQFIIDINIGITLTPESKYGDEEKSKAAESINAIGTNLDALIALLEGVDPAPAEEAPAEEAPAEPVAEAPAEVTEAPQTQE